MTSIITLAQKTTYTPAGTGDGSGPPAAPVFTKAFAADRVARQVRLRFTVSGGGNAPQISIPSFNRITTGFGSFDFYETIPANTAWTFSMTADKAGFSLFLTELETVDTLTVAPAWTWANTPTANAVNFNASASVDANAFSWNFGDPPQPAGTGVTVSKNYANATERQVTLTASHTWPSPALSATLTKTVSPTTFVPVPSFTATPNAANPLLVNFVVTNPVAGFSYTWNFGDAGALVGGVNVSRTYAQAGSYLVSVSVNTSPSAKVGSDTIIVLASAPPAFKRPGDVLRLEFGAPVDKPNKIANPTAKGVWGWETPIANSVLTAESSTATGNFQAIKYTTVANAGGNYFYSEPFSARQGSYAAVAWRSYAGSTHSCRVSWLNAAGAVLATTEMLQGAKTPNSSGGAGPTTSQFVGSAAPAGTAYGRLEFHVVSAAHTPVTAAGTVVSVTNVHVTVGVGGASTPSLFNTGYAWVNILGNTSTIRVNREALNLGVLSASILDSLLDPARYPDLKKGVPVRLTVNTGNGYQELFTGKVDAAVSKYNGLGKTTINLTAVDPGHTLANNRSPAGIVSLAEFPTILEGAGVPFYINGVSAQSATGTVVSFNENAFLIDQIAITRDSNSAEAHVDRKGVLQIRSGAGIPTAAVATLNESKYSDIGLGFDPKALINSVTVKWLTMDAQTLETTEVVYGPYEDGVSILDNGFAGVTVVAHGANAAVAAPVLAQTILAKNSTPTVTATSVVIPIKSSMALPLSTLDIYDRVVITNSATNFAKTGKIATVQHDITPYRWSMTLGFNEPMLWLPYR